jgi:hypothetical protein
VSAYRAIVMDVRDPADKGRIRVSIPSLSGSSTTDWIWPVVGAGYIVLPAPGDQVWVTFENGDKETPIWLGATKDSVDYRDLLARVIALEEDVATLQAASHTHV